MHLLAFGLNHHTASLDVRERAAIVAGRLEEATRELASRRGVSEAAILSTCNRTEVYCRQDTVDASVVGSWMAGYSGLSVEEIGRLAYRHPDERAVRHVLRVASGLDSMVLGEPQILGQMKDAFSAAHRAGATGKILNRMFQHTFSVAKQVRTDTAVGSCAVSVAYAAVRLAQRIFMDFTARTTLLIGAGETIELVARHLFEHGLRRIIVANRAVERAESVAARVDGEAIPLSEIPRRLHEADIVVTSTASTLPILGKGAVESATRRRRHKPIFMVDLAVPRDIEPQVASLPDVYLYTVDDLSQVVDRNLDARREAAREAERIIDLGVEGFMRWLHSLDSVPTVKAFRDSVESMRRRELEAAARLLRAGADPHETLERLSRNLSNKFCHAPSRALGRADANGDPGLAASLNTLFDLDSE